MITPLKVQFLEDAELKLESNITEIILLGFGDHPVLQIIFFLIFLFIYVTTMVGNILIILLVATDQHLQTPMYWFLGNLACLEICCSSNILPRMLFSFITGRKIVSINACFAQHYFFGAFGTIECYLLSAMSYDRYLAICKPLHYVTMMNGKLCFWLLFTSWGIGFMLSNFTITLMSTLVFCSSNKIDHFFCDTFPFIDISCTDTWKLKLKLIMLIVCSICTIPPFILTITSYVFIIVTIMKIPSTMGKKKAFSTCSSHLLVVTIFYGTLISVYVVPSTNDLSSLHKVFSIFYTMVTPMINPIIYSLRNKEVKGAVSRLATFLFVRIQKKTLI